MKNKNFACAPEEDANSFYPKRLQTKQFFSSPLMTAYLLRFFYLMEIVSCGYNFNNLEILLQFINN